MTAGLSSVLRKRDARARTVLALGLFTASVEGACSMRLPDYAAIQHSDIHALQPLAARMHLSYVAFRCCPTRGSGIPSLSAFPTRHLDFRPRKRTFPTAVVSIL